jgi:hypothetical protein
MELSNVNQLELIKRCIRPLAGLKNKKVKLESRNAKRKLATVRCS